MKATRKRWVKELLNKHDALERAVGVPIGEMLGCGAFGCAFTSEKPWVVKLTTDATEARMWEYIVNLIAKEGFFDGQAGFSRVRAVYRLRPGVGKTGKRTVYAVIREEVAPMFESENPWRVTRATLLKLGLDPDSADRTLTYDAILRTEPDLADLLHALVNERGMGRPRADEVVENVADFWMTVQALARYRNAELEHRAQRLSEVGMLERARSLVLLMRGWVGGGLGESLGMLLRYNQVLRDAHALNIGWRVHEEIAGMGREEGGLVMFDPGFTPTPYRPKIEERLVANRRRPSWVK